MLAIERRNEILAKLQEEKTVLVSDLSQCYQVAEETIRRDLEKLEQEGLAKKTYGGAVLRENLNVDLPYNVRKQTNVKSKQKIARIIGDLIQDGDHIMLDASSTALFVVKYIKTRKNITVITNSIEIMIELSDKVGWNVMSTGGTMKEGALALVGQQAECMIDNFHVDKAIISCKGIDKTYGVTDSNEPDVQIKRHIIGAANQIILAADSTKFNKISFAKMTDFLNVDVVVTDVEPDDSWKETFERTGISVLYNN